ncbi:MAG: hypothetical protein H6721_23685 [Sandaracinus sp.]|nr:hypothetical protein [Sandaracinus sp.]
MSADTAIVEPEGSARRDGATERLAAPTIAYVVVTCVLFAIAWGFTVDDAFLVARYARRASEGLGWTFRDGPATDGITGPAWIVPGVVGTWIGVGAPLAQKVVGAATLLGAGCFALRRSRAPWLTAAVLAFQASAVAWGVAGLETGAATFAATVALLGRPGWTRGAALASLPWFRPEAAVLVLAVLVASRASRREWGLVLASGVAAIAFRAVLFGGVLPLAFFAKSGSLAEGGPYVLVGVTLTTGLGGAWLAWRSEARAVVVPVALFAVTVAVAGGDWMPGWRLLVPVLPAYAWAVGEGFARGGGKPARVAAIAACGVPVLMLVSQIGPWRAAGELDAPRRALAERLASVESVALVDVGALVWASDVDVLDLGGLTDPVVARWEGGHLEKRIDVAYLAARDPEVILLHTEQEPEIDDVGRLVRLAGFPVERSVAAHPWTRMHYEATEVLALREGYAYVWLRRRALPLAE